MSDRKRILIVGGVAGGASCAARARRLDEKAEIVVFDRGPYVSFANCGLPYYVGNVIQDEAKLLVASPALFQNRFNIEVRTRNEVTAIDRAEKTIEVRELETGQIYRERYDALVLSPGAAPIKPPLPGIDLPGIFALRTIPDSRQIREWIEQRAVRRAVVVGGGFIGLEMAENLAHRGIEVSIVEMADQVMPPLDREMAEFVRQRLVKQQVALHLGGAVTGFEERAEGGLNVRTQSGVTIPADLVILGLGVKPETDLAKAARLEIGQKGGICVSESMQTSDPSIWAVGDAVEVKDAITGEMRVLPLAGPANRQGRIAADAICGRDVSFRGTQGTAVCGCFGLTIALTGATEKSLTRSGQRDYECVYLHPSHHVGYYPGAKAIHLKLIYRKSDGLVLGAQAVGEEGVERRIDVIAMAIQKRATVFDLEDAELCYAPQYGGAKDPVNFCGMVAANAMRGDVSLAGWKGLPDTDAFLLDVRDPKEFERGAIEGAVNIPLNDLRLRLGELPKDREIWINCGVGQRSYYAVRLLRQNGLRARNLPGGYTTYRAWYPAGLKKTKA